MATDIEDELLPESQLPDLDVLWWWLQLLGGVVLTAVGLPVWIATFVLGWQSDRIAETATEPLVASPVPGSVAFLLILALWATSAILPVVSTYFHARELDRQGAAVDSGWTWPLVALFCTNVWPLYWLLLWKFRGYRQGVSTEVSES